MKISRAAATLAACIATLGASASTAQATQWGGWYKSNAQDAAPAGSYLTYSMVLGAQDRKVGAGAHVPGSWTMYGSYAYAYSAACHSYSGNNNIGAMLINASPITMNITAYYGTSGVC